MSRKPKSFGSRLMRQSARRAAGAGPGRDNNVSPPRHNLLTPVFCGQSPVDGNRNFSENQTNPRAFAALSKPALSCPVGCRGNRSDYASFVLRLCRSFALWRVLLQWIVLITLLPQPEFCFRHCSAQTLRNFTASGGRAQDWYTFFSLFDRPYFRDRNIPLAHHNDLPGFDHFDVFGKLILNLVQV